VPAEAFRIDDGFRVGVGTAFSIQSSISGSSKSTPKCSSVVSSSGVPNIPTPPNCGG
jgi:hypothetical protein